MTRNEIANRLDTLYEVFPSDNSYIEYERDGKPCKMRYSDVTVMKGMVLDKKSGGFLDDELPYVMEIANALYKMLKENP